MTDSNKYELTQEDNDNISEASNVIAFTLAALGVTFQQGVVALTETIMLVILDKCNSSEEFNIKAKTHFEKVKESVDEISKNFDKLKNRASFISSECTCLMCTAKRQESSTTKH